MAGKPKPGFWIVVFVIVIGLIGYSLYKAGDFSSKDEIQPGRRKTPGRMKQLPKAKIKNTAVKLLSQSHLPLPNRSGWKKWSANSTTWVKRPVEGLK